MLHLSQLVPGGQRHRAVSPNMSFLWRPPRHDSDLNDLLPSDDGDIVSFEGHMTDSDNLLAVLLSITFTSVCSVLRYCTRQCKRVSKITFGIATFAVQVDAGRSRRSDSCFLKYDGRKNVWIPSLSPPAHEEKRNISQSELCAGFRKLVEAGCFFYTFASTRTRQNRPVAATSTLLNDIFSDLGFDSTSDITGGLGRRPYKLYKSKLCRPETAVVSVVPYVDGSGVSPDIKGAQLDGTVMVVTVSVKRQRLCHEQRRLRQGQRACEISENGLKRIRHNFRSNDATILMV